MIHGSLYLSRSLVMAILIFCSINSFAKSSSDNLPNFRQVNENIFRGGRPTANGLKILKQKGIKLIINLEDSKKDVQFELTNLIGSGIEFVSVPFGSFSTPKNDKVNQVLEILNNADKYPIYIHCHHGEDRTGLLVALYKVEHGTAPADAYREMLKLGFHRILFSLNHYFEKRTGFED